MVVGYKNEWENSQFYAKNEIKQKSSNGQLKVMA